MVFYHLTLLFYSNNEQLIINIISFIITTMH